MRVDNNRLLDVIHDCYDQLDKLDPMDKEYERVLKSLNTCYTIKNKDEETFHENVSKYLKIGGELGLGVATTVMTYSLTKRGFKFEETGVFQSQTFRGLFRGLRFKK